MRSLKYSLIATLLLTAGVIVGFQLRETIDPPPQYANPMEKFKEVFDFVIYNYFKPIEKSDLVDKAIIGMLNELDPHSFYIPAKEMKEIQIQMQGSFEGIGIEFAIVDDTLLVVAPLSGGPSEAVGLKAGDRIVEVDGKNIAGIGITNNDVFKLLRGPKGTKVTIKVKRPGVKELLEFTIIRDKIPVYSVDYSYMINDSIGYIKITRFAETTFREFMQHLRKLKTQGLKHLILDLRSNPGGYLRMAEQISDVFLSEGKMIVYTKGRIPESNQEYFATPFISGFEHGGLVILIDEGSASASEIVSGAVQDWDRGLIVGRRSFGKGLVQHQKILRDGSAIRIVIARYYTPSGRCIQKPFDKSTKAYEREIWERFQRGEVYDSSKIQIPDSLKFKTKGGRIVYGGGGIIPDVFVPRDTSGTSPYLTKLFVKGIFREFAIKYAERHPEIKNQYQNGFDFAKRFQVDDKLLKELTAFAEKKGVKFNKKDFEHSKKYIAINAKAMIGRQFFREEGFYPVIHQIDNELQKAIEVMPKAIDLYHQYYLQHP